MNDSNKIKKLNEDLAELIKKYRTEYMSDTKRNELRAEIDSIKNSIKCITYMK